MGKSGGSKVKVQVSPLEQKMADIAGRQQDLAEQQYTKASGREDLLNQQWFDPLRGQITPQIVQALGTNPFQTKLSAPERAVYEQQYNQARANTMNTAAPGGLMRSSLRGLERDRAGAIGAAAADAKQRGIGRALQFAGGVAPTAINPLASESAAMTGMSGAQSALGAANSSASQRSLAQAQMNAQNQSAKGSGIGSVIGKGVSSIPWGKMF
jgi:hypothetical protein